MERDKVLKVGPPSANYITAVRQPEVRGDTLVKLLIARSILEISDRELARSLEVVCDGP